MNAQKQIAAVDDKGRIISSVPFGERYSKTKKEAIKELSNTAASDLELYETTTSFQKKVRRVKHKNRKTV